MAQTVAQIVLENPPVAQGGGVSGTGQATTRMVLRHANRMETGKRGRSFDWTGQVFGELTVVKRLGWTDAYGKGAGSGRQLSQWELKCSCGNTVVKTNANLRSCTEPIAMPIGVVLT